MSTQPELQGSDDKMTTVSEKTRGAPQAVVNFFRGLETRDMDLLASSMAPDARWTLVGRPDRFAMGGERAAVEAIEMLRGALPAFDEFLFMVEGWAQNGNLVFVEAMTRAVGPGTARYNNRYLMRFRLREGLISEVLEHYDPFEVLAWVEEAGAP